MAGSPAFRGLKRLLWNKLKHDRVAVCLFSTAVLQAVRFWEKSVEIASSVADAKL